MHSHCGAPTITMYFQNLFHHPKRRLCLSDPNSLFLLPQTLVSSTLLSVSEFAYSRCLPCVDPPNVCPFVFGLFHLAQCFQSAQASSFQVHFLLGSLSPVLTCFLNHLLDVSTEEGHSFFKHTCPKLNLIIFILTSSFTPSSYIL